MTSLGTSGAAEVKKERTEHLRISGTFSHRSHSAGKARVRTAWSSQPRGPSEEVGKGPGPRWRGVRLLLMAPGRLRGREANVTTLDPGLRPQV